MSDSDDFEVPPWVARRIRRIVWTLVALLVAIPIVVLPARATFTRFPFVPF